MSDQHKPRVPRELSAGDAPAVLKRGEQTELRKRPTQWLRRRETHRPDHPRRPAH